MAFQIHAILGIIVLYCVHIVRATWKLKFEQLYYNPLAIYSKLLSDPD